MHRDAHLPVTAAAKAYRSGGAAAGEDHVQVICVEFYRCGLAHNTCSAAPSNRPVLDPTRPAAAPVFRLQRARTSAGTAAHSRHVHPPPPAPPQHSSRTRNTFSTAIHLSSPHARLLQLLEGPSPVAQPHADARVHGGVHHILQVKDNSDSRARVKRAGEWLSACRTSHVTRHTSHVTRHRALPPATPFLSKLKTTF